MNAATASLYPQLDALRSSFLAHPHRLLIDGQWVPALSGETLTVLDPATGRALAEVAAGGAADIDLAVKAARKAFRGGPWSSMSHSERGRLLYKLADLIEREAEELALLESLDGGNPVRSTRHVDVAMAIESLRYNAGWTTKLTGDTALASAHSRSFSYTLREPIGVVGAITPWNAPLLMAVNKIAPALATGCTVVLKPAELAPLTALRLGELLEELGLPPGVVNIVTGYGHLAGQALVDHPDVNKISFTGSTRVGRSILAGAASNMKRVTLELGGKSPVIILPDADIEAATLATSQTIFFKTGQFCAAGTRLFAHQKVFDRVVQGFADRAAKLKIGPGTAPDTDMGPVISQKQLDRVMGYIGAGERDGAQILLGGKRIEREGYFVQPTLLAHVRPEMSVFQEEIFGPVLCAMPFNDAGELDQLAELANDTSYGLAANIWTRDLSLAHRLARRIQAGTITINGGGREQPMPFGGYKQSGLGREGGRAGIEAYTELKTVAIGL
ncbi:MAG TPA: aldehyde dehydrogenase family protein [Steroidobacteraceae bacterium]|nr:aldehyde dehydrogenase family protein [Steroidobacteraceae bacterium]